MSRKENNGKKYRKTAYLPAWQVQAMKRVSEQDGVTQAESFRLAITAYVLGRDTLYLQAIHELPQQA